MYWPTTITIIPLIIMFRNSSKDSANTPKGIENINVQRMLLSSGSNNHLKNVPMAIFLEINSCIKE